MLQRLDLEQIFNNERFIRNVQDKIGALVELRPCDEHEYAEILTMYDEFEPKESAQGLPPAAVEKRQQWVSKILRESINVMALVNDKVVGHACLIDIDPKIRCEYEVMVHQDWQNRGIGTQLTKLIKEIASLIGYEKIWLTVDSTNHRAMRVYQICGFKFTSPFDVEREMESEL